MWLQDKYADTKKFIRSGKLAFLTLPKDSKISENLYKLNIKAKSMDFQKGKDVFILSDTVGIVDDVEITFFFLDEILCVRLDRGFVYVRDNGIIKSINQKHKIQVSTIKESKIIWKSIEDLKIFTNYIVKDKYNLVSERDIKNYRNNLLFTVALSFTPSQGNLFSIKFLRVSEELGGGFDFEVKEKIEEKISTPIDLTENSFYTDKRYKKVIKHSNYKDADDSDDLDSDNENELSNSMHEINIFNDYIPLDE